MNRYNIGRRIAFFRDKMSMSTQELANRIERSQATISRIENGKQGINFELVAKIARELRVHPFALLSDEPLRESFLIPVDEQLAGNGTPTLLAYFIYTSRVRTRMSSKEAAQMLDISPVELELIELGIVRPEPRLFEKIANLYAVSKDSMTSLVALQESDPEVAHRLAYIFALVSKIYAIARKSPPEEPGETLGRITNLLEAVDAKFPLLPDLADEEKNQFLNGISVRLTRALRDDAFREKVLDLIEAHAAPEEPDGQR